MQLFHVTFPDRMPGLGLLVLRVALALMLVCPWGLRVAFPDPAHVAWAWMAAALLATGSLLPLALLLSGAVAFSDPALDGGAFGCLLLAAWLAGPGAYSVDAVLFGRRVLHRPAPRRLPDAANGGRDDPRA